ncbi:aldo/keto reductase [Rhodococcus wratislaviensis]|uniref:Aldo/keto reductase n=1 Tax=Rhodococcus wratislaviensis NBRC 100605 TaxID=1219028 RepID=X0PWA4_RHOWR|nr:aldo/keto reductase [Rhodococcus wratislaviensis]GAF47629.1 hypothetical protein RW1_043_00640 [Rhodococcus wratislaviensis NBRC 100605]
MTVHQIELGNQGLVASAIGFGCMPLSGLYGQVGRAQALEALEGALDAGITLLDTADVYGFGHNETLVGTVARRRRDDLVIATKAGFVRDAEGKPLGPNGIDGRPEHLYLACDASLRRLGIDTIDLYQLHRVDPRVPIEESVGALGELVRLGKVRHIGLSEAQPEDIRRAHREHPVSTVQNEYSLVERGIESEVLRLCRELGIGVLAYAPLCRGLLAGTLPSGQDGADTRNGHRFPRLASENREANSALVATVADIAEEIGCSAGQVALAWLLRQGVAPIPGTKRRAYALDNAGALAVALEPTHVARLDRLVDSVSGARYGGDAATSTWVSPQPDRTSVGRPRVVVTGHNAEGRSVIARDSRVRRLPVPDTLGYASQPIWATQSLPVLPLVDAQPEQLTDNLGVETGGVRFVQVVVMPSSPESHDMPTPADRLPTTIELVGGDVPGLHFTHSVDLVTVLEGKVVLSLEGEEVALDQGDAIVQNGTTHAWRNDTNRPARLAVVRLATEHRGTTQH